jgi:hypothetical protein
LSFPDVRYVANNSDYTYNSSTNEFTFLKAGTYEIIMNFTAGHNVDGGSTCAEIYPQLWNGSTWVSEFYTENDQLMLRYNNGNNNNYTQVSNNIYMLRTANQKIRFVEFKCSGYTSYHHNAKIVIKRLH